MNAVCPVYFRKAGLEKAHADSSSPAAGNDLSTYLSDFASTQAALGVISIEEQVAQACLFLASPAVGVITAQRINVDCDVMSQ